MATVSVTWVGVIISFIAVFAMNMTYFGMKGFYPAWTRALGQDAQANAERGAGKNMAPAFTLTTVALFVQAFMMDWIIQAAHALYGKDVSFISGLVIGLGIGAGIAAATSLGHRVFSGQGLKVWIIESGADILGLGLMGAIFSFWH
jgi:hypothetical protein